MARGAPAACAVLAAGTRSKLSADAEVSSSKRPQPDKEPGREGEKRRFKREKDLRPEELDRLEGEELPSREAMSVIKPDMRCTIPLDPSIAADVLSDGEPDEPSGS